MKGQVFLISAAIIIVVFSLLQIMFFQFQEKNLKSTYDFKLEYEYFLMIEKEIFLSPYISDENSLENFIDFLNFSKTESLSKNQNINIFAVHVSNYDDNPSVINVTFINFMDKGFTVYSSLNSTPEQSDSFFLEENKQYSKNFFVERSNDYSLFINYTDTFNLLLDLKDTDTLFIFLDFNASSTKVKYIDKSQKTYYFS